MFDLHISTGRDLTEVAVRSNALDDVGSLIRECLPKRTDVHAVLITDENVGTLYSSRLIRSLDGAGFGVHEYRIAPGEASKSLAVAGQIYQFLAERNVARDAIVVALGGGVVSDLAGFVAATWMRGLPFAICPTTLEADIDACIGGKTAINVPGGKNLVGAFHQPFLVAVDPGCLSTLDGREVRAGLAESVKHALISSEEFLSFHEVNADTILALDPARTAELIFTNLSIKARIVEEDAHERRAKRILLNFGHTVGHAIETCCGFALRHGECVALGMLAASRLSHAMGLMNDALVQRVEAILTRFGLPTRLVEPIETDRIIATIRNDKKVRRGLPRFVLLKAVGRPVVRDDVPEELVRKAYESLLP